MYAGLAHGAQAGNRPAELGLQRAMETRGLQKPAGAEAGILAQALEANASGLRQSLGSKRHARAIEPVGRHQDGAAVLLQLERDIGRLKGVHDRAGVLCGQIGEQRPVQRLLHPHHQAHTQGDRRRETENQRELAKGTLAEILAGELPQAALAVLPRLAHIRRGGFLLRRQGLSRLRHDLSRLRYTCIREISR